MDVYALELDIFNDKDVSVNQFNDIDVSLMTDNCNLFTLNLLDTDFDNINIKSFDRVQINDINVDVGNNILFKGVID